MPEFPAFIVSSWDDAARNGAQGKAARGFLTGRLADGRSFAAVLRSESPAVFVDAPEGERSAAMLASRGIGVTVRSPWKDFAGRAVERIELAAESPAAAGRILREADIACRAMERSHVNELLASRGIQGPVTLRGEPREGRRVDLIFFDPELEPPDAAFAVRLRWLALDIETDRDGRVVAVSLAGEAFPGEVLFLGPELGSPHIRSFGSEADLLSALAARIVELDPDILTGWNVIDFDLRVLAGRYAECQLAFDIGRSESPAAFREVPGRRSVFEVPGRAALDSLRLVRASGQRFEDLSLESVARSLLGEGKSVSAHGEAKLAELERLRLTDPAAFCDYCLRDSQLVLRILDVTGLGELTAKRAALTGVALDLAWTSIPAFERVYGSELRRRRILPPARTERSVSGAAGGTVLDPATGLFSDVLVFDFRSLYPSIMRTFNIDPFAYELAAARPPLSSDIVAPNGARFDREPGILPELITRYTREREAALAADDPTAAYVYKILMNSFYGVLGSAGCRYARTELAGAITSFGKKYLTRAKTWFEARGQRVLYGDTDSVFVLPGDGDGGGYANLFAAGESAARLLNAELKREIKAEFGLESRLHIRCEKIYGRFLIPRLKSDQSGEGRGRAKGYAGLVLTGTGREPRLEVKGMEAARTDFTPLARRFQLDILGLAFSGATLGELEDFCRTTVRDLRDGRLDERLTYRRSLRRPARDYATETPAVRAARLLGWEARRGRISYVMTQSGAEPVEARSGSPLDYDHYSVHQLMPIGCSVVQALAESLGSECDASSWFADRPQMEFEFG
ncbi:MAG TPA: DNA polymerase domain-containing protein [Rectinemataceae bacterium]|nr:DNA polymerase domain-containing protein [Rectinemataceae bacterium]